MNKRLLGILIVMCSFLIFAGVIYWMFFNEVGTRDIKKETVEQELPKEAEQEEGQFSIEPTKKEVKTIIYEEIKEKKTEVNEIDLKRMAASFAERFGSYSNQSNFSNIDDLKIFMSRRMQKWADNFVRQLREKGGSPSLYYGITTKAIFQEVLRFDDDVGVAEVLVKTQRREATGAMANASSFYQDILTSFIKEEGVWKVESADWIDR